LFTEHRKEQKKKKKKKREIMKIKIIIKKKKQNLSHPSQNQTNGGVNKHHLQRGLDPHPHTQWLHPRRKKKK
jgi:hypothetical protein